MSQEKNADADASPKNKGGRPRKDVTQAPEFQAAVAKAVEEAMSGVMPSILAAVAAARGDTAALPVVATGDNKWAQELAMQIATLTGQASGIKPIDPAEVQRREEGRKNLIDLLARAHTGHGAAPHYRVLAKAYLTDFVVEPFRVNPTTKEVEPVTVDWTGIPNESLLPLNETAAAIHAAFMQSIGGPTALTNNFDSRNVAVTPGGLVVRGLNESARRNVTTMPEGSSTDLMGVRGPTDPRAKTVRVLGSVADPAIASGPTDPTAKFAGDLRAHG